MRANGSPPGGSILTTEAPIAHNLDAATGPGRFTDSVRTHTPLSGILPDFRSASAALMRTHFGTLSGALRPRRRYSRVPQAPYRAYDLLHGREFVHYLISFRGPLQASGVEVGAQDQHPPSGLAWRRSEMRSNRSPSGSPR